MARTLKISGMLVLIVLISIQISGCLETIKQKGGEKLEQTGKNRMDVEVGTDTKNTSILSDAAQILTGIFKGEKNWNSLFAYFIATLIWVGGLVLQGKKIKKKFIAEGELKDKGLELVTDIIGRFMRGEMTASVLDGANENASKIVAEAIADEVESKSGAKHSAVGAVIHAAIKKSEVNAL